MGPRVERAPDAKGRRRRATAATVIQRARWRLEAGQRVRRVGRGQPEVCVLSQSTDGGGAWQCRAARWEEGGTRLEGGGARARVLAERSQFPGEGAVGTRKG